MNETVALVLAAAAGLALGAIFFGGLWWTVQKVVLSKWSGLWILGSLLVRTSAVLTGFYFISRGHWEQLLLCLLGFIAARYIVMRLTRSLEENQSHPVQEATHAH